MILKRKCKLEERVNDLEVKYEQLAKELGRVEKDITLLIREMKKLRKEFETLKTTLW